MKRCDWVKTEHERLYHDKEWGKENHDDRYMFEMLVLEGMQAGLSWATILSKREAMRKVFLNFDYIALSQLDNNVIYEWLNENDIIKNKLKLKSVIDNAKAFLTIQKEFGSFDRYIWEFVDGKPIMNHYDSTKELPAQTELSQKISKDLKKRGFKFVGPVIVYSFLQAIGIINDHVDYCSFK